MLPLLIAAGASIAGNLLSAKGAQKSAQIAADANLSQSRETNALNERLFNESRGAGGHSVLPVYFGGNEAALGQSAYNNFQRLSGAGEAQYSRLLGYQGNLAPAFGASLGALSDRYTGSDVDQRQAYLDPVQRQRTLGASNMAQGYEDVARAGQGGINYGLQQAIAQINAQRSAQGFAGSSLFDRNRLSMATIGAQQAAMQQMAAARFQGQQARDAAAYQNAQETAGVNLGSLDFRANPAALTAALGSAGGFLGAPAQALSSSYNSAMTPLNYFRISPQAFQAQNMPMQEPQLNNAQILGSALGQGGSAAANYFLNQSLAERYGGGNGIGQRMSYDQFQNQNNSYTPVQTDWNSAFFPPQRIQSNWGFNQPQPPYYGQSEGGW